MDNKIAHNYKDYGMQAALLEGQQPKRSSGAPGHNDSFPVQLHWMLEETEKNGKAHIISWSPHGRAFSVRDRDAFLKEVLPAYFRQSKITSFQRQLSLYGFKRITKGPDSGSYYHPMFLRNSRMFVRNIVRTKVKNDGPRKAAAPEEEPDLYAMPRLPDPVAPEPKKTDQAPRSSQSFHATPLPHFAGIQHWNAAAASTSESDILLNRVLIGKLLQQQKQQQQNTQNFLSRMETPVPASNAIGMPHLQSLASRNTAWLKHSSSPLVSPDAMRSNLFQEPRSSLMASIQRNNPSKTIADLLSEQNTSYSLGSLTSKVPFRHLH